jgi:hypothetical protein
MNLPPILTEKNKAKVEEILGAVLSKKTGIIQCPIYTDVQFQGHCGQ